MTTDRRAAVSNASRCVALLALAIAARGTAQPASPPGTSDVGVVVAVEADPRCATTAALRERVRARSARIQFVRDPADVPQVRVILEGDAPASRARKAALLIEWPDGRRAERHLHAGSCASALDALALLLVMTLDDQAGAAGTLAPGPGGGEEVGTPRGDPTVEAEDAELAEADESASADAVVVPGETPKRPFQAAGGSIGVSANLVGGPAPSVMPGFGARAQWVFAGVRMWTPALALGVSHVWKQAVPEAGGDASFKLTGAALDVCPLGVRLGPFTAHGCVSATAGRLRAQGDNSFLPRTHVEPWASVGGAVLLAVALGHRIEVQGGFALTAPLVRYGFAFQPDIFYRVPVLAPSGHLGLGVRFP